MKDTDLEDYLLGEGVDTQKKLQAEVVLRQLPKKLYVYMITRMKKTYPGLPAQWFPMKAVAAEWTLDAAENIFISRRGYL